MGPQVHCSMSRFWAVATGSIILDIPLRVSFLGPDSDTLVLFTEDEVRQALSALPETAALPDWDFSDSHISVGRFPIRGGAARRQALRHRARQALTATVGAKAACTRRSRAAGGAQCFTFS